VRYVTIPTFTQSNRITIIGGPTGIGKSSLAIQVAKRLGNAEIVSADSVQLYKELNAATNKVDDKSRLEVPHYGIDVTTLNNLWNVADYYSYAIKTIADINARNHFPIFAGGAMYFTRWILYGPVDDDVTHSLFAPVRLRVEELLRAKKPLKVLYDEFKFTDAAKEYIQEVAYHKSSDIRRIARAAEVAYVLQKQPPPYSIATRKDLQNGATLPYDVRAFFLTTDREWLSRITDYRCEQMIFNGLFKEVVYLMKHSPLLSTPLATTIGYKHAIQFINARNFTAKAFLVFLASFQAATRQFVRRQFSWARSEDAWRYIQLRAPSIYDKNGKIRHPSELEMDNTELERAEDIIKVFSSENSQSYWNALLYDETTVASQITKRENTRMDCQKRKEYITQLFIYNNKKNVENLLADLISDLAT
jgi:tRNA dimethylallyltransferase